MTNYFTDTEIALLDKFEAVLIETFSDDPFEAVIRSLKDRPLKIRKREGVQRFFDTFLDKLSLTVFFAEAENKCFWLALTDQDIRKLLRDKIVAMADLLKVNQYSAAALRDHDTHQLLRDKVITMAEVLKLNQYSQRALWNKGVQQLLRDKIITMDDLSQLNRYSVDALRNCNVQGLLRDGVITIHEVLKVNADIYEVIQFPDCAKLLRDKVVTMDDLLQLNRYSADALRNCNDQGLLKEHREIIKRIDVIQILEKPNYLKKLKEAIAKEKERQQVESLVNDFSSSVIVCALQFPCEISEALKQILDGAFAQQASLELQNASRTPEFSKFFSQLNKIPGKYQTDVANEAGKIATVVVPRPRCLRITGL